jgi:anti-anti-sigma factor
MASDCFALSGHIDGGTVPALRDEFSAFISRTTSEVALDCTDVSSIDREGIGALIAMRDQLARDGRCLHFVRLSDALIHDILVAPASDVPVEQRQRVPR